MVDWSESSDFASRFRGLYDNSIAATSTAPSSPPNKVQTRLNTYQLKWAGLDPLLKSALLWDAGYVRGDVDKDSLVQVYTKCDVLYKTQGDSMANIAVTMKEFLSTNANETTRECISASLQKYHRQENSQGPNISKVSKCAIALSSNYSEGHSSMWAQDALGPNTVPELRVFKHTSPNAADPWLILSIHALPGSETLWGACPAAGSTGAIIIPCIQYPDTNSSAWCLPKPSDIVDKWLQEVATASLTTKPVIIATTTAISTTVTTTPLPTPQNGASGSSNESSGSHISTNSNTGLIVGISAAVAVVLAALVIFLIKRKKKRENVSGYTKYSDGTASKRGTEMQLNINGCLMYRLDEDQLHHDQIISHGASGEVWLGKYKSRPVAIKRMLSSKNTTKDVQNLIEEIELMGR